MNNETRYRHHCEAQNGVAHLPEEVLDAIWNDGYGDHDGRHRAALLAWNAARKEERIRVIMYIAGWTSMSPEIVAQMSSDMERSIPL